MQKIYNFIKRHFLWFVAGFVALWVIPAEEYSNDSGEVYLKKNIFGATIPNNLSSAVSATDTEKVAEKFTEEKTTFQKALSEYRGLRRTKSNVDAWAEIQKLYGKELYNYEGFNEGYFENYALRDAYGKSTPQAGFMQSVSRGDSVEK